MNIDPIMGKLNEISFQNLLNSVFLFIVLILLIVSLSITSEWINHDNLNKSLELNNKALELKIRNIELNNKLLRLNKEIK